MDIPQPFNTSTPLHIGDYIVLRLSKPDEGWLSSEGLLDDECFLSFDTEDFHNSIWQIHVQNQYSATREYKDALAQSILSLEENNSNPKSPQRKLSTPANDYLAQLHRAALNEQRLNDKLMYLKMGKPVNFGDPLQLRHVKSRKFLTISANVLAREERENMRVSVDADGDSLSCIGFIPRYRYEREGQVLTNNSEVQIRVHERPGEFLHFAKTSTNSGGRSEVNCSLESSFWTVLLYQRAADANLNSIMAGELVSLQDPDSLSCISLDSQIPGVTEKARIIMSPPEISADSSVGSHLLWLVEKANVTRGGPLLINVDSVTFRDLNTGLYMRLETDGLVAVKQRSLASTFEFHNSQNVSLESSYLETESAVHLASGAFWIGNIVRNEASKTETSCGSFLEKSSAMSLSISSSLFHKIGVHLYVGVQATMKLRRLLHVTKDYELGNAVLRDLSQEVKSCNAVLESLCSFLSLSDNSTKDELVDGHNKEKITIRQNMVREQGLIDALLDLLVVTECNIFDKIREPMAVRTVQTMRHSTRRVRKTSVPKKEKMDEELDDPLPLSTPTPVPAPAIGVRPQRRSSFSLLLNGSKADKPANAFALAVKMSADRSTEISKGSDRQQNLQELVALRKNVRQHNIHDPSESDDEEEEDLDDEEVEDANENNKDVQLTISQLIAQKCLKVLLCILIDNFANQLYIADRFPILLGEVKDHRLAVLCVEEMLRENLTILQTKVRQREIDIFVSFLAKTEMSVTFLRLLQSTCSCPMGVDATQRMVAQALFGSSENRSRAISNTDELSLTTTSPKLVSSESRKSRNITLDVDSSNQRLTIQIIPDRKKKISVDWGDLSLYCSTNVDRVVQGYRELADGLPEIWLTWRMKGKNGDFSMQQLFGYREKVPLTIVCSAARKSISGRNKPNSAFQSIKDKAFRRKATVHKKKGVSVKPHLPNQTIVSIANLKAQVAEYFKTQLYLVADLCLDRNYVSIGMLEPLYPYDILIAMLMSPNIPTNFKAPVCRIIRCLYVDRDPQVEVKFPHYIRTSMSLVDAGEKEEDEDAKSNFSRFALVQKILSKYVHDELDLAFSDELSTESLELLEALVQFGFYEKVPQILDILKPLLRVLDLHQHAAKKSSVDISSEGDASSELTEINPRRGSIVDWSKKWINDRSTKYKSISHLEREDEDKLLVDASEKVPWFQRWAETSESLTWMIAVFSVVILSVAIMIIELIINIDFSGFYIASTIFFGVEFFFRLCVNVLTTKKVSGFVGDPFNLLDLGLIALDVIMLSVGSDGTQASATRATRGLRIIRIVRAVRLLRAARLVRRIAQGAHVGKDWEIPKRYQNIKRNEAKTMVNILKVLTMFYDRIQDHTLDLGLKAFSQWSAAVKNQQNCDPVEIFQKALISEERLSSELSHKFEAVLLDAIMFADKDITHSALNLLMIHKSQKDLFFKIFEQIQIIYSPRIENICRQLTAMLRELQGLAEMFEIWSELESANDLKSAARCLDILKEIMAYLSKKNDDRTLAIRSLTLVDEEVQNLLRNLDAMTVFMAVQESLFDGGREELKPQIVTILSTCNELICMFVKTSEANQSVAFKFLQWFVDRVDDGIGSSQVARCIVEGNKSLIKQCSRRYLSEFSHKIVSHGRKPEYLDLFVGMTELSEVMDSHVLVVETEISTYLTGREWKKHILLWCAPAESAEYMERRSAMQPFIKHDGSLIFEHQLTPDLRYHIRILVLLASCNLGPKLHAIYPVQDILFAIMDAGTIFPVKKALGILLIEMLKSSSDRVEKVEQFWEMLDHVALEMESLPTEMLNMVRNHELRIQRGEWLEISAGIIATFFQDFDMNHYLDNRTDKAGRTHNDAKITIERLYRAVRTLIDLHAQKIGGAVMEELSFASTVLQPFVDPDSPDIDNAEGDDSKVKLARQQHKRTSIVYADVQQLYLRKQFKIFLRHIKDASKTSRDEVIRAFKALPRLRDVVDADVRFEPLLKKLTSHFRSSIKRSPLSRSINESAVETCGWFLRMMRHLLEDALGVTFESLHEIDVGNLAESEAVENLRSAFNDNGVTYLCLDLIAVGMDHELYIEAIKLLITMLLKSGGCRNIQKGIYMYLLETDSILFFELVKDMIESLKAWTNKENENNLLQNGLARNKSAFPHSNSNEKAIPEDVIVLNLLQGICEGSYMGNRDYLREQSGNSKIVNVFESLASFVGALSRSDTVITHPKIVISLLKTVLRQVQGPCKGNQEQFVLHTELLISLNRMIRSARPNMRTSPVLPALLTSKVSSLVASTVIPQVVQQDNQQFEQLKESIVDVLRGVIEGQPKSSLTFDRVATTIDFSVLQLLIIPPDQELFESIMGPQALSAAQAKFLVLTESMKKNASLFAGAESSHNGVASDKNDISSVEVRWNNQVQVIYFPVPQSVKDLSAESKSKLLENDQDFASRELKLMDFVHRIKIVHRESKHQQWLKRYGFSDLWSVKYYLTRLMFVNAIVMNCIIVAYYGMEYHHHSYYASYDTTHRLLASSGGIYNPRGTLYAPPHILNYLNYLNIIQLGLAVFTVGIFVLVKMPVTFSSELEKRDGNVWMSVLFTLLDPLPIWYMAYLAFTFLGLEFHHFFLSALLLDWIVLDSTTQDLLLAVQYPARQLAATLVMILIMHNIFAGVMFEFYRQDVVTVQVRNMWDALKLCISYGFRGEYGIDHEMEPTLGARMVLDVIYFFVMLSILRHIFFAIIVDTFGKLRELKFERESEAKNTCFICGIERHDFDRIVPEGMALSFTQHRNAVHNPFNYMAFIMNLWQQSESQDSSLEIYVRDCLRKGDVSWFPTGVAHEAHATVVEAHVVEGGDAGGGAHHKRKHGHGHGHSTGHGFNSSSAKDSHEEGVVDAGHAAVAPIIARRPRTGGAETSNAELVERMVSMQQQLVNLSKTMQTPNEVRSPTRMSFLLDSSTTDAENLALSPVAKQYRGAPDPALVQAVTQMNAAMVNMMARIDTMEKNLTKSHKYLRHRLRLSATGKVPAASPSPSPAKTLAKLMKKKQRSSEEDDLLVSDREAEAGERADDKAAVGTTQKVNADISSNQSPHLNPSPQVSEDGHVLPQLSPAVFVAENIMLDDVRPGAEKLENSDDDSSLTSSRCTVHSDKEDSAEEGGFEKENLSSKKPHPTGTPSMARPTSAAILRSPPMSAIAGRPQSARNAPGTTNRVTFTGPPKSLVSNDAWK